MTRTFIWIYNNQTAPLRPGGDGPGTNGWAVVAELDHFPLEGYEQYLIDALDLLGIHVSDQDFHP